MMEKDVFTPLLTHEKAKNLMRIYAQSGYEIRFVGGCVRDCLVGREIGDIDLATTATPEQGQKALSAAGIKTIPTGIDHGTITAVVDRHPFEITTLRRDTDTDGRHATVSYTDSWEEDAARRDFTFNAMSLSFDGALYDPFGGQEDLKTGRIRFIGDPVKRITEDYLRILRFFRFHAHFGQGDMDADGLKACVDLAKNIESLSKERIRNEVFKLLKGQGAPQVWQMIVDHKINQYFLEKSNNIKYLKKLFHVKRDVNELIKLLSLYGAQDRDADGLQAALKLSNKDTKVMKDALKAYQTDWVNIDATLYYHGVQACQDAALLRYGDGVIDEAALDDVIQAASNWHNPQFPVTGDDLLKKGIKPGKELGEKLKALEKYWVDQGFKPIKEECLSRL